LPLWRAMTQVITVERAHLVRLLDEDGDYYPHPYKVVLNRNAGQAFVLFDDDDDARAMGIPAGANDALKREVLKEPSRYLEIPLLSHAEWHTRFRAFLQKTGKTGYFGSIGGWFDQYGDDGARSEWSEFRAERAVDYARQVAAKAGVRLEVR
jgi:hypothetical protein